MKANTFRNNIYSTYYVMKYNNYFLYTEILSNIKRDYMNVKSDQKNSILSLVAYNNIKSLLKNIGYKFTNSQFNKAIEKRISQNFNLLGYLRNVPKSKKKLNELEIKKIKDYLDYYSREYSSKDINVKYL